MKHQALLFSLMLAGCASVSSFFGTDTVTFAPNAEDNLARGLKAMKAKNYTEAETYLEHVRTKYPYVDAATESELLLGDCDFAQDKFVEARDRYTSFVKLHPNHARVDYAAFRAALTHYKEIPSDFFLLPASSEKEQIEVRNANVALSDFIRLYPKSSYRSEAQKTLDDVHARLAAHEYYVADFYAHPLRQKWRGVTNRLLGIEKNYPGVGYDEKVAFGLYDAYLKLDDPDNARAALERYVAAHTESSDTKRAKSLIAELAGKKTAPPPVEDAPDAGT